MSLVKDKTSLNSLEAHIQRKKDWRKSLIAKLVSFRAPPTEQPSMTENQIFSPRIKQTQEITSKHINRVATSPHAHRLVSPRQIDEINISDSLQNGKLSPKRPLLSAKGGPRDISANHNLNSVESESPPLTKNDKRR